MDPLTGHPDVQTWSGTPSVTLWWWWGSVCLRPDNHDSKYCSSVFKANMKPTNSTYLTYLYLVINSTYFTYLVTLLSLYTLHVLFYCFFVQYHCQLISFYIHCFSVRFIECTFIIVLFLFLFIFILLLFYSSVLMLVFLSKLWHNNFLQDDKVLHKDLIFSTWTPLII